MPAARAPKHKEDSFIALMHLNSASLNISDIVQMCCHSGKILALAFCTINDPSIYLGDMEIAERKIKFARHMNCEFPTTGDEAVIHLLQIEGDVDVTIYSEYKPSEPNVEKDPDSLLLAGAQVFDMKRSTRHLPTHHPKT